MSSLDAMNESDESFYLSRLGDGELIANCLGFDLEKTAV